MPIVSIVMGTLLVAVTAYGFIYGDPAKSKMTALIPAFVGGPLILCGLLALKDSLLKHAMHVAAMLGVLGFLASGGRLAYVAATGDPAANPVATQCAAAMMALCAVFVALCVRSFIAARRRRLANPA